MSQALRDRRVSFVDDPHWPDRFANERDRLSEVAGDGLLDVHHVGSTAFPDVPGKPALDVIVVYADEAALKAAVETLVGDHGFERPEEGSVVIRWEDEYAVFVKLHLPDDEKVHGQVAFRDYLLDHPEERRAYAACKREAKDEHADNLAAYTQAKGEFVASVLDRAREVGYVDDDRSGD